MWQQRDGGLSRRQRQPNARGPETHTALEAFWWECFRRVSGEEGESPVKREVSVQRGHRMQGRGRSLVPTLRGSGGALLGPTLGGEGWGPPGSTLGGEGGALLDLTVPLWG